MLLFEMIVGPVFGFSLTVLSDLVKKMLKDIKNSGNHNQVPELIEGIRSIISQPAGVQRVDSQYIEQQLGQLRTYVSDLEKSFPLQSVRDVKKTLDTFKSQGVGRSGHLISSPLVNSNSRRSHDLQKINGKQLATTSSNGPYLKVQNMVVNINLGHIISPEAHGGSWRPVGPNDPNTSRICSRFAKAQLAKSPNLTHKSPAKYVDSTQQKPEKPNPKKTRTPGPNDSNSSRTYRRPAKAQLAKNPNLTHKSLAKPIDSTRQKPERPS